MILSVTYWLAPTILHERRRGTARCCKRLLDVFNDVVHVLCPDGQTDEILGDATCDSILWLKMRMRSRPGMPDNRFAVTDASAKVSSGMLV